MMVFKLSRHPRILEDSVSSNPIRKEPLVLDACFPQGKNCSNPNRSVMIIVTIKEPISFNKPCSLRLGLTVHAA